MLEEIDPAGVILYVMDWPYSLPFHTVPVALAVAAICVLIEFPFVVI